MAESSAQAWAWAYAQTQTTQRFDTRRGHK